MHPTAPRSVRSGCQRQTRDDRSAPLLQEPAVPAPQSVSATTTKYSTSPAGGVDDSVVLVVERSDARQVPAAENPTGESDVRTS